MDSSPVFFVVGIIIIIEWDSVFKILGFANFFRGKFEDCFLMFTNVRIYFVLVRAIVVESMIHSNDEDSGNVLPRIQYSLALLPFLPSSNQ